METNKWLIFQDKKGVHKFIFSNTDGCQDLGDLSPETTEPEILAWVIETGQVNPGDVLNFVTGRQVVFMPPNQGTV